MLHSRRARYALLAACLLMIPTTALAQDGTIAGTIRDAQDAVLPGVTVEVTSPALIGVRTTIEQVLRDQNVAGPRRADERAAVAVNHRIGVRAGFDHFSHADVVALIGRLIELHIQRAGAALAGPVLPSRPLLLRRCGHGVGLRRS